MNSVVEIERIANQFFEEQGEFIRRERIETPERIGAAYEAGAIIGAVTDSEELPHDLRQFARNCRDEFRRDVGIHESQFATASGTGGMYGDYKGQLCIHYRHHLAIDPAKAFKGAQLTGDCFVAGTMVLMADGSEKPIEKVQAGESVLSRTGVPRRVLGRIEKPYSGDLVTIEAKGYAESVTATPDHRFTVFKGTRYESGGWRPSRMHLNAWQAIEDVGEHPVLLTAPNLPVKQTVFDIGLIADGMRKSRQVATERVPLDDKLAWAFGLYLAEGSCEHEGGEPMRVTYSMGAHETELIDRLSTTIRECFGVNPTVSNLPSKPSVTLVRIPSKPIAVLFARIFPGNQWTKCVPSCLLYSPIEVRKAAIRGWMDGDGHVRVGFSAAINARSIQAQGVSASPMLRRSMFRLMLSCKIKPSMRLRKKEYHQRVASGDVFAYGANALAIYPEHVGSVATKSKNPELCEWGLMAPVAKKTTHAVENTTVYCLEVEEEHSFVANGYAVHNCVSWSKRTMRDMARCFDIGHLKQSEEYVKRSATADLYSMRGHTGAGASPSRIANAAVKIGILLEGPVESDSGEVWDFTDYKRYYQLGMKYGRTGFPRWIYEVNAGFGPQQVAEIHTDQELLTALWNGCGVGLGSQMGIAKVGGKDGVPFLSALSGSWAHDMCYSSDTEILTDDGWINVSQMDKESVFATLNPDTHQLEWQRASQVNRLPFSGKMLHFEKRGIDAMVTPNHRMYGIKQCRTHPHGKVKEESPEMFEFIEADSVSSGFRCKKNASWEGAEIIAHELPRGTRVPMDMWLEFLGYYLSEGSVFSIDKIGNRKRVLVDGTEVREKKKCKVRRTEVSQTNPEGVRIMGKLLKSMPFSFRRSDTKWQCDRVELWEELESLGKSYEKRIPDYVWQCSSRQLEILFNAMCLGDGSKSGTDKWTNYQTTSQEMAGDFQRLLLQIGLSGSIVRRSPGKSSFGVRDIFNIYIRQSHSLSALGTPEEVDYEGYVYCPTTANGIVYVRRNGKPMWCGNCTVGFDDTRQHHKETLVFIDQSWGGSWNRVSGWPPEYGPIPEGMCCITLSDYMKHVRRGECHALSDSQGFRPRRQATLGAEGLI